MHEGITLQLNLIRCTTNFCVVYCN